jgi:hypothetical protein
VEFVTRIYRPLDVTVSSSRNAVRDEEAIGIDLPTSILLRADKQIE